MSCKRAALLVVLLLAGGAALAEDDEALLRDIERDIASVDTQVRADAFAKAASASIATAKRAGLIVRFSRDPDRGVRERALRLLCTRTYCHRPEAIVALFDALDDPDPTIVRLGRESIVNLDARDFAHAPMDRIARQIVAAPTENDRFHFVQIAESALDGGARLPPGSLLVCASEAKISRLRERAFRVALKAAETAPIVSSDLVVLERLLASDDPTVRFDALQVAGKSSGPTAIRVLLEAEVRTADTQVREFVTKALDERRDSRDYRSVLEDIAKTSTDEALRAAAKKRLASK
ncbi:MAG: HEAT repeat domain-containing protein [Planctomycetota bacterium]